ncbi:MAG: TonB-dependent receptor [Caulobacteraceae bacterium]
MVRKFSKSLWLASAGVLGLAAVGGPSFAQSAADQSASAAPTGLGEIVVTAERRTTDVQHAALAITALSGDALLQNGVVNAQSLIEQVPGIYVTHGNPLPNIFIRGVGGGVVNAYHDPAVAYNIDDVYVARPYGNNTTYYDLDRVEVLKGPQGTLYGRNATAGAINVISKKPLLGRLEAEGNLQLGNYNDVETNGALNLPVNDVLAARVSFRTVRRDGYLSAGADDSDSQAARIRVLYKPSDTFNVLATASYFHDGGRGPGTVLLYTGVNGGASTQKYINPSNPWTSIPSTLLFPQHNITFVGLNRRNPSGLQVDPQNSFINNKQWLFTANATWNLGAVTLSVIPSYVRTPSDFLAIGGGMQQRILNDSKETTVEARLANNDSGRLRWIVGGYFLNEDQTASQTYLQNVGPITLNVNSTDRGYAAFGQATYSILSNFRLTGGVRFSEEEKTQNGNTVIPWDAFSGAACSGAGTTYTAQGVYTDPQLPTPFNFVPFTQSTCAVLNAGNLKFSNTSYKAGVEWDVAPRSLLYANVSSGFKAGGFNPGGPPTATSNHPATYLPEKLTAYAVGSKNRFWDNRLQFNAEAFYWEYKDANIPAAQNINPAGFAFSVLNGDAHIWGVDTDTSWLVTRDDRLTLGLVYTGSRWDKYVLPATVGVQGNGSPITIIPGSNLTGKIRANTPEWSGTAGYNHTFNLKDDARVVFDAVSHFESSAWTGDNRTTTLGLRPAYHLTNLTLTYWAPGNRWSAGAFVDNVENADVFTGAATSNVLLGGAFGTLLPPRTYGVRFSAKVGG